jgi:hypothetical protein
LVEGSSANVHPCGAVRQGWSGRRAPAVAHRPRGQDGHPAGSLGGRSRLPARRCRVR